MMRKWTTRYSLAAVILAVVVISISLFANPSFVQNASAKSSFAVLLTDPPTVPAGTTQLNLTYSDISLHVTYADNTTEWLSVGTSGTINSFALVNMSQTIASTTIPTGSTVDKIQFTLANVEALINGTTYNVSTLSNTLVLSVGNSRINQTLSGVLIDFNPTLLQIQSSDADGNPVAYYVLVPSATASIVNSLDSAQIKVGTIVHLGDDNRARMTGVVEDFSQNLSIEAATLQVNGDTTSLSVTLKNNGDLTFRVFGLMLQGELNTPQGASIQQEMPNQQFGFGDNRSIDSIPFQINDSSLTPLFNVNPMMHPMNPQRLPFSASTAPGLNMPTRMTPPASDFNFTQFGSQDMQRSQRIQPPMQPMNPQNTEFNQSFAPHEGTAPMAPPMGMRDDRDGTAQSSYLALQPGQEVTLTFTGTISIPIGSITGSISPIVGNNYTIRLMGEGFQTFTVTATA
jgi:hypothetical protein